MFRSNVIYPKGDMDLCNIHASSLSLQAVAALTCDGARKAKRGLYNQVVSISSVATPYRWPSNGSGV
jgi:hypothetical protein